MYTFCDKRYNISAGKLNFPQNEVLHDDEAEHDMNPRM